jgi:nucleotide-binding universal stress UspA family protein
MSFAAFLVYVEADAMPKQRVRLAANLADRFAAHLIGVSALAIPPPIVANGMVLSDTTDVDIELMRAGLTEKGDWFRRLAGVDRHMLEWRQGLDFPLEVVSREARSADLVILGQVSKWESAYRTFDPGRAILKMGRPALVVPKAVSSVKADHIVIGWKDTREARRAVRDAVPFLQRAVRVTLVGACEPDEELAATGQLDDVTHYLRRHDIRIKGSAKVVLLREKSGAEQLIGLAQDEGADLLVTGAYGHSRLGEWIFGGMTRDLITTSPICCFMSH